MKQAETVVRQLTLPWADIIRAIEAASMRNVGVLNMQPDAQHRVLKLTAEAKSREAMLEYVRRIAQTKGLSNVYIVNHQVRAEDPSRTIQFPCRPPRSGAMNLNLRKIQASLRQPRHSGRRRHRRAVRLPASISRRCGRQSASSMPGGSALEQSRSRSPLQTVSALRTDDLQRFYLAFPAMDRLPDELERLYGLARASRLDPSQAEYRLEQRQRRPRVLPDHAAHARQLSRHPRIPAET